MKTYIFNKTDSGYIGNAFEMAIKDALERNHSNRVMPAGQTDLYYGKHYDIKQNGTVLQYNADWGMIRGSSRVIYATHVAYNVVAETEHTISIQIDLGGTEMYCLDRKQFLDFILNEKGFCKYNESRGTINLQTMWNYKKNAYHGKKGKVLEAWMQANQLKDDPIVTVIKYAYKTGL